MRSLRLLIALVVALAPASLTAGAAATPLPQESGNAAGRCLAEGKVWLLIVTDTGRVIANQCVGNPATGEQAIRNAGVPFTHKPDAGYICTIGGYPEVCKKKFNGQYWTYYQAQGTGDYHYSDWGANVYQPKPGAIEAWCYNKPDEYRCVPPKVKIVMPSASTPTPTPKPTPAPTTKPASTPTTPNAAPTTPQPGATTTAPRATSTAKPAATNPATAPAATSAATTVPASTSAATSASATVTESPTSVSHGASASSEASATATAEQSMIEPNAPVDATLPPADNGTPVGVIVTGGVLALGGAGFAGWQWYRRRGL